MDIFISYAHLDNEPLVEEYPGWVTAFHRVLEKRLRQLLGEEPSIWRDTELRGHDLFDDEIAHRFGQAPPLRAAALAPGGPGPGGELGTVQRGGAGRAGSLLRGALAGRVRPGALALARLPLPGRGRELGRDGGALPGDARRTLPGARPRGGSEGLLLAHLEAGRRTILDALPPGPGAGRPPGPRRRAPPAGPDPAAPDEAPADHALEALLLEEGEHPLALFGYRTDDSLDFWLYIRPYAWVWPLPIDALSLAAFEEPSVQSAHPRSTAAATWPLWYPWRDEDRNARFRFVLRLGERASLPTGNRE